MRVLPAFVLLSVSVWTAVVARADGEIRRDWWSEARAAIEESEYRATQQGEWHFVNRAHGFRARFSERRVLIEERALEPRWSLSLDAPASNGAPGATLEARADAVEIRRGSTLHRWSQSRGGLVLELTFDRSTKGFASEFTISGELSAVSAPDTRSIDLVSGDGRAELRGVIDLALDGAGRAVDARFEVERGRIRIVADGTPLDSPLTVVVRFTGAGWTAQLDQQDAGLGASVATAGDVNGDGYSDVLVGAPRFDNGELDEGAVFLFLGSPAGPATTPDWIAESNQPASEFGAAIATAGDVDGDGFADVLCGSPAFDAGQDGEGAVFLFLGSASGLGADGTPANADWTLEGEGAGFELGRSLSSAADLDTDGYSDVIVGAPRFANGETGEGAAFVFMGSPEGLGADATAADADWSVEGGQLDAELGRSVAWAGDLDADGFADIAIGAPGFDAGEPDEGAVFVFHGAAAGLASPADPTGADGTITGNQPGAAVGGAVATAGDVNGDGFADLAVGAPSWDGGQTDEGAGFVFHGSATGIGSSRSPSDADWAFETDQNGAAGGTAIASAGDLDGDGIAELILGAPGYTNPQTGEGAVWIFEGSTSGLSLDPDWAQEGNIDNAAFGASVAPGGDVDGDGLADVLLGSPGFADPEAGEGRVQLRFGTASGIEIEPGWTAEADQANGNFGHFVASAGDVNGDGYDDVIVGADFYDNGEEDEGRALVYHGSATGLAGSPAWVTEGDQPFANYGHVVAAAGDVDGDGYDDVIVSAYLYDNGEEDEGRAYLFHGSSSGLATEPAWIAESNNAGAFFGGRLGPAGDVNGDGYADVIVGALNFTEVQPKRGAAFVYLGSPDGLEAEAVWHAIGSKPFELFGVDVGRAGDVDGDGYDDVIVGSLLWTNGQTFEGAARVYHGSPGGVADEAAWQTESNSENAMYGHSVASAGDVNADGFADVIVGAIHFTNGEAEEGAAFVYHGSPSGLSLVPAWTDEGNQPGANLGFPVASAGDVNGDGYSDVILGVSLYDGPEPDEGRALLYHGGPVGLATTPDWSDEGDQATAEYGFIVNGAGDVNGDGYADVIVGAHRYTNDQPFEGRAFVYHGNGGGGPALRPRQLRLLEPTPISRRGVSDSVEGFRLSLLGRTPFGRSRVKLEWEVVPYGEPLDGSTALRSPDWIELGAIPETLWTTVSGFPADTALHWRLRLLYEPAALPFAQSSRWVTGPWNATTEIDLRTAAVPAGRTADGGSIAGDPLRVGKAANGALTLDWTDSCLVSDTDFAIYEGSVGEFTSHVPESCSTAGLTSRTIFPGAGNRYYLIVPHNGSREGSPGTDGDGRLRPRGAGVCFVRLLGSCD